MILVPLFDLKFLTEFAAGGVGTSIGGTTRVLIKSADWRSAFCANRTTFAHLETYGF
jgi:hypothetical protein